MIPLTDSTMRAVEFALQGIQRRSQVTAQNLSNLNTPNYISRRVDFESALRSAMEADGTDEAFDEAAGVLEANAMGMPDAHGTTVHLETEMTEMIKTNLLQDAMVNAYNFKLGVLRSAIGRR